MKRHGSALIHTPTVRVTAAWVRRLIGFGLILAGMIGVTSRFGATSSCWLMWVALGLVAGAVDGRSTDVWLVAMAAIAFYPTAAWLGLPASGVTYEHWAVLNMLGAFVVAAGFVVGTLVWWRPGLEAHERSARSTRPASRWLVMGAVALALIGVSGWAAYSGVVGSGTMLEPLAKDKWLGCDTPASRFGWTYEAINYDPADDARLLAANPDQKHCTDQGATAGTAVVASDGVPIAGWYIPARSGLGPTGPTLVVAPGWKSNKSEILKYAPPFHDDYNLVLVDLRNGGRSGGKLTTWGYRERDDVRAMVDWLERTKKPSWVGAVGNSMGAATVLAEAAGDPRVRALILDSMHASVEQSVSDGIEHEDHLPGDPTAWAMTRVASFRIGGELTTVDPIRTITQLGDRPVLLIHGRADALDRPEHSADLNLAAAKAAGVPAELHYCPTGTHGEVIDECPDDWAAWSRAFLDPLVAAGS
jgi:fermentation-respiration switch protein FrsA (DUF1100 family)